MLAVAAVLLAVAAPVPVPTEDAKRIETRFGKPVDPKDGARFLLDGGKLTIRLPDQPRLFSPVRIDAPHTVREVEGDFTVRVQITLRTPDPFGVARGYYWASYYAGIAVWRDEQRALTYKVSRWLSDDQPPRPEHGLGYFAWEGRGGGGDRPHDPAFDPSKPVWLRLTRRGELFTFERSTTGEAWKAFRLYSEPRVEKVKLGVFAAHTCTEGFDATFEHFAVEPLAAK